MEKVTVKQSHLNIGQTVRTKETFVGVLETGAGTSYIRLHEITEAMRSKSKKRDNIPEVRNVSSKAVPIFGTITLVVWIGKCTQIVNFLVTEKLPTSVIFGCEFCPIHVEAIKLRLPIVKMDDDPNVPIIQQTPKPNLTLSIIEEQEFNTRR